MAENAGDKSFEATPHRRQEAREQGQVVFSQDLGSAALLMLGVLLLMLLGGAAIEFCATLLRHQLGDVGELHTDRDTLLSELLRIAYGLSVVMLPIFGLMMLGGIWPAFFRSGCCGFPNGSRPISVASIRSPDWAGFFRLVELPGSASAW